VATELDWVKEEMRGFTRKIEGSLEGCVTVAEHQMEAKNAEKRANLIENDMIDLRCQLTALDTEVHVTLPAQNQIAMSDMLHSALDT
jgi:hypothetical protein